MMLHEKTTQRRPAKEMAAPVESLHPRNPHRGRYNFRQLVTASPELAAFVLLVHGNESINFSDPAAVKALNRALLIESYGINGWDIPEQYLCPPWMRIRVVPFDFVCRSHDRRFLKVS
jgi:23S rRNA (adenine1618-N6)-methyltransferase